MPFASPTTRMPGGLTNAAPWQTFGNAGAPDPTFYHQYANDFDTYLPSDWTVSVTGTGTQALQAGYDGGGLLLTTSAAAGDTVLMQLVQAGFKLIPGKEVFFKWAGQLVTDLTDVFYAGLVVKTGSPLAVASDGVFLLKTSGSQMQLAVNLGGVQTLTPLGFTPTAGVDFEVGFHIDGQGNIEAFYNPTTGNNPISAAAGVPRGRVAAVYAPALTASALAVSFGIQTSTALARALICDYVVAARAR